jgi:hypothetical protein
LWLRAGDLPRLRSWAVSSNPIYRDGLAAEAAQAKADMDAGLVPEPDPGDLNYRTYPTEIYAELFAFMSLVSPDQAERDDYANRARRLLMFAINRAAMGPAEGQPFRDPCFASCDSNASKDYGEGFALTVDWIYSSLSAEDKRTIRTVFLRWSDEILNLGYHAPQPVGVVNSPELVRDPLDYRWAVNNYVVAHMRNLGLMAMALDPADDPDGTLHGYLRNATGARLYMWDYATRHDARGGLPPEGFEYGPGTALPCVAQFLLALHTAGEDDPGRWGPQVSSLTTNSFWDEWMAGWLHSQSPAPTIFEDYIGPEYQTAWYGDAERYGGRETIGVFGPMAAFDSMTGNTTRLSALRWMQANLPPGGINGLTQRAGNSDFYTIDIFYFLLFDPDAGTGADPRPSQPLRFFAPGLGRILARTGWDADATWFDYKLSWTTIDHQLADGNQFEFYRRGEWLVKERSGYDLDAGSSIDHNALALQNDPWVGDQNDYRYTLSVTGSQWTYAPAGDPRLIARSFGADFVYALGDATNLYNYVDGPSDITHASRSIVWLQPDVIVVYDRAASKTEGRFKRFHLTIPNRATIDGTQSRIASASGRQQLVVTTLLPADAAITSVQADILYGNVADYEPMGYRLIVDARGGPRSAQFLHVLQGTDAGASAAETRLVQSTAGTAFAGAVVRNTAVMFPVDINATFTSVSYSVPAATTTQLVTGLVPNAAYDVSMNTSGDTITVRITAGAGANQADSGGVLIIGAAGRTSTRFATTVASRTIVAGTRASSDAAGARRAPRETTSVTAPSSVTATASGSSVVLMWNAPSGVTPLRYVVSGGTAPHASTLPVVVTPDASTSYTIPSLPSGTYYFRVLAILTSGLSPPSEDAAVATNGSASATGPATGALASADGRTLTLAWTPPERGASVYYVEIGSAPGRADVATLATTQPSVTYRARSATYYLRVRAARGAMVSEPSNETSTRVSPAGCTAAPPGPILLPVSTTRGETTISWLAAEGAPADHYRVDGAGPTGPVTMTSVGGGTSLTARLEPGTYSLRVTALNACGMSGASNQIVFTKARLAN